jgi:hypothetical protein
MGMMGYYFGSSTLKYSSGTQEEFEDALRGHKTNQKPQKVQFYFSIAAVDPTSLDLLQLERVKKFKKEVGGVGLFYREFEDLTKLGILVRQALIRDVLELLDESPEPDGNLVKLEPRFHELKPYMHLKNLNSLLANDQIAAVQFLVRNAVNNLDLFVLDLNGATAKLNNFSKRMTAATREAVAVQNNPKKVKFFLKQVQQVFEAMESFIDEMLNKIGPLEENFSKSISSFQRAANIQSIVSQNYSDDIAPVVTSLRELRSVVGASASQARTMASSFPAIDSLGQRWESNRRILAAVLDDLAEFQERMISSIDEVLVIIVKNQAD